MFTVHIRSIAEEFIDCSFRFVVLSSICKEIVLRDSNIALANETVVL